MCPPRAVNQTIYSFLFVKRQLTEKERTLYLYVKQEISHTNSYQRCIQLQKENPANITTIGYRAIRYVLLTTKVHIFRGYSHFIY